MVLIYYYAIKLAFFLGLLRSFLKFEPLQKHTIFLGALYTSGIAALSYAFLIAPQEIVVWRDWEMRLVTLLLPKSEWAPMVIGWRAWQLWLVETFVLMTAYLRLLARFDEGTLFWIILLIGLGLVVF